MIIMRGIVDVTYDSTQGNKFGNLACEKPKRNHGGLFQLIGIPYDCACYIGSHTGILS